MDPETVKALQRTAGNRAVTRMLARTPEETVELLEQGLGMQSPDGDHVNRTLSPYSFDREGWGKVGEAFKQKTEKELAPTMQTRLAPDDLAEAQKRLPR